MTPGVVNITVTVPTLPSFAIPSFPVTIANPPPPVLTSVSVTPSNATFNVGATQQFTVAGVDQYGNPFPISSATWAAPG